jgi:hypothetical protein
LLARLCGGTRSSTMLRDECAVRSAVKKECTARAVPMTVPRGYKSH